MIVWVTTISLLSQHSSRNFHSKERTFKKVCFSVKLSFVCFEISRERSKKSAVRTHFHFDFRNMETWLQNKTLKKLPIQSITEKRIKIGNQEVMN